MATAKTKKKANKIVANAPKLGKTAKKPSAAKKKSGARKAVEPDVLSSDERSKLLKPRTDFLEVLARVSREWKSYRALRAPGLTSSKLASLGKKAERAGEKERAASEASQRKLVPLADARRIAHDAAYRALLDTHAAIKLHARLDPGVVERFAFLAELVRNQAAAEDEDSSKKT